MQVALIHNHYDQDKLDAVKKEMLELGAPVIKAVYMDCYGIWAALEGCHRIRAAKDLGIEPVIETIEYSDTVTTKEIGLGDAFDGDTWTIAELVDGANQRKIINFN